MIENIECQFIYSDIPLKCYKVNIIKCVEFNMKKYSNLSHDFVSIFFSIVRKNKLFHFKHTHTHTQSKPTLDHCCFYVENLQCAYPTALKCAPEWAEKLSKTDFTRSLCAIYSNKEIRTRCPVDQEIMSLIGRTTWNNRKRSILGMMRPGIAKKTKKDEHIRESSDKTGKIPTSIQFGIAGVVTLLSGFFATMSGIFMERGEAKTYALTGSVIGTIIGAAWLTKVASSR